MIATMVTGDPDPEDLRKFFRALSRAQRDIDLRPDLYTHYYKKEFPARYHATMDTRRWGPGERLVFEPYTKEVYEETFKWIAEHGIFADSGMGSGNYEDAVIAAAHVSARRHSPPRAASRQGRFGLAWGAGSLARGHAFQVKLPVVKRRATRIAGSGLLVRRRAPSCAFSASLSQRSPKLRRLGCDLRRTRQFGAPRAFGGLRLAVHYIRRHRTLSIRGQRAASPMRERMRRYCPIIDYLCRAARNQEDDRPAVKFCGEVLYCNHRSRG